MPAKKVSIAPKAKGQAKAPGKPVAAAQAKPRVQQMRAATPQKLKKTTTAPKSAVEAPSMLSVVAAPARQKAPARPAALTKKKSSPVSVTKPVQEKVRIFQIYYRPEQREHLDPAFEPYNNEGDNSPLLEFNVFRKLMNTDSVKGAELWGALSWKFKEKTGITGEQLRQFIGTNPGYDVYYCNPHPEVEGLYHNLWLQGETSHPNFLILCRDFFQAAGLDENIFNQMVSSQRFAASNYFVASHKFWTGYLGFINEILERAESGMSATARAMIYSSAADQRGLHAGASYLPFIVERLLGVYLEKMQGRIRALKYPCESALSKLNVHLKLLTQMKDVAISSKSLWMASCWVNYRNLYMQQFNGKEWCAKYISSITPREIKF